MTTTSTWTPTEAFKEDNALLREYGNSGGYEGPKFIWRDINGQVIDRNKTLAAIKAGKMEKAPRRYSIINQGAVIQWAYSLAHRPQYSRPVVCLDTETTGIDMTAVAVQIGIVNLRGETIMKTLVCLDGSEMSEGAQKVHGLSTDRLNDAPMFPTIWETLRPILETSDLVAYNMAFDARILAQTAHKYGLKMPTLRTHCLMQQYAMYHGELASAPSKSEMFVAPKLEAACEHFSIELIGAHDALTDARATRDVLVALARLYQE